MALSVVVGAEIGGQAAVGRHTNLRGLIKADARAHHAGEARRRDTGRFDIAGDADAAAGGTLLRVAGNLERPFEYLREIAAVVGRPDRCLVGHRARRDEIAAPDLGAIDAELERGLVREALQHIAGLRASGAAIRIGGHRVAEDAGHLDEYLRRAVYAGKQRAVNRTWDRRAEARDISAKIGGGVDGQ